MNYELTKKLKDAGFPQRFKDGRYYAEKDLTFAEAQEAHAFLDERRRGTPETELEVKKLISIPTLPELIEKCLKLKPDNMFFGLHYAYGEWTASIFNHEIEDSEGRTSYIQFGGTLFVPVARGSSAEEAIANLWLALNKKP